MSRFKPSVKITVKIARKILWKRYTQNVEYAITETTDSIFLLEKINLKVRNIKLNDEMAKIMNAIIIRFNKNIIAAN